MPHTRKAAPRLTPEEQKVLDEKMKTFTEKDAENLQNLINAIESLGLEEFIEYIKSPWKLLWPNFVAGMARGLGYLVGASIVVSLIVWMMAQLVDFPLVGKYFKTIQTETTKYIEQTNYTDEFEQMQKTLEQIEKNTTR